MKKHLATISILIKDRQTHAKNVNDILTKNGNIITSRLGVNLQKSNFKHCNALIIIVVEGLSREISSLTNELDKMYGVVAEVSRMI